MSSPSRKELAAQLSCTGGKRQIAALLRKHSHIVDIDLARALREECYAVWQSEPARSRNADLAMQMMADRLEGREANAIAEWLHGIAEMTEGRLENALVSLSNSSALYRSIGEKLRSAETIVATLIPLAMLGQYSEALKLGKRALKAIDASGSELTAGKVELNLSNIAARLERYRDAESLALSALERFKALGDARLAAMTENGLGITYTELGRFDDARAAFERALEFAARGASEVTVAEAEASLANLFRLRGEFDDALLHFERSRERFERLAMPHQNLIAQYEIAAIYTELNLTSEAEDLLTKVCPGLAQYKMAYEEAGARVMFAEVLRKRSKPARAKRQYEKAAELYRSKGNILAADAVTAKLALLHLGSGNLAKAREFLAAIEQSSKRSENQDQMLLSRRLAAEIAVADGNAKKAEKILDEIATAAARNSRPQYYSFARNALGELAMSGQKVDKAIGHFEHAVEAVEAMRSNLPGEAFRIAFFSETTRPFENLMNAHLRLGQTELAFGWHERMRSRALNEMMAAAPAAMPEGTSGSSAESRKGHVREELNVAYQMLDRGNFEDRSRLEAKARRLEAELTKLERRELVKEGRANGVSKNESFAFSELQRKLGKDAVLVEFFESEGRIGAFVAEGSGLRSVMTELRPADILTWLAQFDSQLRTFRHGQAIEGPVVAILKRRTEQLLGKLGVALLGQLGLAESVRKIVLVPTGPLFGVPFAALRIGGMHLIERFQIAIAPSASIWLDLAGRKSKKPGPPVAIGYSDDAIPFAEEEAREIAKMLDAKESLIGRAATTESFVRAAVGAGSLHIACHGLFRADNPMYSSLQLADGRLTAADAAKLRLKAELVTLSACETGRSEIAGGDEMLGLARGFLSAGAGSLIISLWNVSDRHTIDLMRSFYSEMQRTSDPGASLQKTQIALVSEGLHPYFWAPFCYIGQ
ncbi:MAG: CHAT domain-containing protein [Acidobacteria bacterium]|nr:CHAT domain-containing protein [Acidobacteriota bacterium]